MWGASRGWGRAVQGPLGGQARWGRGVPGEKFPKPETRLYRGPSWCIGQFCQGCSCLPIPSKPYRCGKPPPTPSSASVSGSFVDPASPLDLCPQALLLRSHTALSVWLSPAEWGGSGGDKSVQGRLGFPFPWMVSDRVGLRAGGGSSLFHVRPTRTCGICRNLKTSNKTSKAWSAFLLLLFLVSFLPTSCTGSSRRCP